jgi:hypothetical protein
MFFGMDNKVIQATEMFNKDITIAYGRKRRIRMNTCDPLINTTFHLRNRIRSIQRALFTSLPLLTREQLSLV